MELDKRILQTEDLKARLNLRLARDFFGQLLREDKEPGLLWLETESIRIPLPLLLLRLSLDNMVWIEKIEAAQEAEG